MNETVSLWWFRVDRTREPDSRDLQLLNAEELARARRFRVVGARQLFVAARAAVRRTLGLALDRKPTELKFDFGEHGKPKLQSETDLRFNLSHSGSTICIAAARNIELGVDVEEIGRTLDFERLATRFFASSEARAVAQAHDDARRRLFFHCWTAKEAVLKATGSGLSVPVRDVEVNTDPEAPLSIVSFGGDRDEAMRWQLMRTEEPGKWMATVAFRGEPRRLVVMKYAKP